MARTDAATPAEQITELLRELDDEVITREKVPRYRRVSRDKTGRTVAVLDWVEHVTHQPGLLTQLGVVHTRTETVRVDKYQWVRDPDCGCKADRCRHDQLVKAGTEQRTISGVLAAGAAVPGGSPGWDADGALAPLTGGGKPDPAEPISDTWHVADEIQHNLADLVQELRAEGRTGNLITDALNDERTGRRIAARLHGLVQRARIAADYDAPIIPLRDVCCPDCGGELRVRADASSSVWCAGRWTVEGPALLGEAWPVPEVCGARWPRGAWVQLLAEAEREAS